MTQLLQRTLTPYLDGIELTKKLGMSIKKFDIALDTTTNDQKIDMGGNFFYFLEGTDDTTLIQIRFNEKQEDAIPAYQHQGWKFPFRRTFLSWTAQAGHTATIIVGNLAGEFLDVIDNRASISATMQEVERQLSGSTTIPTNYGNGTIGTTQAELIAANANRVDFSIQAGVGNSNTIYVGFDNSVSPTNCWVALAAGQSVSIDDYQGAIWIEGGAASQDYCFAEFI